MIVTDCTRDDCQIGKDRCISYAKLSREYRCNDCGGCAVVKWSDADGWHALCGKCGGRDFVHEVVYQRQRQEGREVLDGLPNWLAAQLV